VKFVDDNDETLYAGIRSMKEGKDEKSRTYGDLVDKYKNAKDSAEDVQYKEMYSDRMDVMESLNIIGAAVLVVALLYLPLLTVGSLFAFQFSKLYVTGHSKIAVWFLFVAFLILFTVIWIYWVFFPNTGDWKDAYAPSAIYVDADVDVSLGISWWFLWIACLCGAFEVILLRSVVNKLIQFHSQENPMIFPVPIVCLYLPHLSYTIIPSIIQSFTWI
jgi:hypothetical protein